MKKLFIEVKGEKEINVKLPSGRVGLISSVQYLEQLKKLKIKNSVYGGLVLGCNASNALKIKDKVDYYLFLGEGRFQALEVSFKTGKVVYIASGDKITQKEIEDYKNLKRGKLLRFLSSKKKGILVSIKPGQNNFKKALELNKKIKNSYIFIGDEIKDLENFTDIDCWINTACSRIEGKNIINAEDIPNL